MKYMKAGWQTATLQSHVTYACDSLGISNSQGSPTRPLITAPIGAGLQWESCSMLCVIERGVIRLESIAR